MIWPQCRERRLILVIGNGHEAVPTSEGWGSSYPETFERDNYLFGITVSGFKLDSFFLCVGRFGEGFQIGNASLL